MIRIPFQFVYYAKLKSWLSEFLLIASWELFCCKARNKVTKKFIVLYQRKGFWLLVFSLLFGFTEKCRSSKIPRGFLKVAAGHIFMSRAKFHSSQQSRLKIFISHLMIHLGENVWFNINQTFYMRNFWPTLEFIFQISKCKYQSVKLVIWWVQRPGDYG